MWNVSTASFIRIGVSGKLDLIEEKAHPPNALDVELGVVNKGLDDLLLERLLCIFIGVSIFERKCMQSPA